MQFATEKIAVEVRIKPMTPHNIVQRPTVFRKTKDGHSVKTLMRPKVFLGTDGQTGQPIYAYPQMLCPKCNDGLKRVAETCDFCNNTGTIQYFSNYEKVLMANNTVVTSEDLRHFIHNQDTGKDEQFPFFQRSQTLNVQMEIPRSKLLDFYFDGGWGEIVAPSKTKTVEGEKVKVLNNTIRDMLWKEAERYVAENIIGVMRSFVKSRGHKEWYAVVFPTVMDNGKFGWLVGYTTCTKVQSYLMPIPTGEAVNEERQIPSKSFLPEIESLVK